MGLRYFNRSLPPILNVNLTLATFYNSVTLVIINISFIAFINNAIL